MKKRTTRHKYFTLFAYLSIGVIVLASILQPAELSFISNYSAHIMLAMLLLGFVWLVFKQEEIAFANFFGCFILAFFLKVNFDSDLKQRTFDHFKPALTIAHVNWEEIDGNNQLLTSLNGIDADVVSCFEPQNVHSEFDTNAILEMYPYLEMVELNHCRHWIFARQPIEKTDTIRAFDQQYLTAEIKLDRNRYVKMFFTNLSTQLTDAPEVYSEVLYGLAGHVSRSFRPNIIVGTFNSVSWSNELQQFLSAAELHESRKSFMPAIPINSSFIKDFPLHHIFYSVELDCVSFSDIYVGRKKIGVAGTYQIRTVSSISGT